MGGVTDVGPSTPVRRGQKGPPPAELAAGQWGVVDRRQLLDGGLSSRFLGLVEQLGLPTPLVNHVVLGRERDFVRPAPRLVVEVDGFEYHRTRDRFEDDRARDRTLTVAGWRVARITDEALEHEPHTVAADLRLLVERTG